ncbi:hypothetical protein RUND412_009898 [Rhizina undulata]
MPPSFAQKHADFNSSVSPTIIPSFLTPRQQITTSATSTVHAQGTAVVLPTSAEFLGSLETNFNSIVRQHADFSEQLVKFREQLHQFKQLHVEDHVLKLTDPEVAGESSLHLGESKSQLNSGGSPTASFSSDATFVDPVDEKEYFQMKAKEEEEAKQKAYLFARKTAEKLSQELRSTKDINERGIVDRSHSSTSAVSEAAVPRHPDNPSKKVHWLEMQPRAKTNAGDESEFESISEATVTDSVDDEDLYSLDVQLKAKIRMKKMRSFLNDLPEPATSAGPQSHGNDPDVHVETDGQEDNEFQAVNISHVIRDSVSSVSDNKGDDEDLATPEQLRNPSAYDHVSETDEEELIEMGQPIHAFTPVKHEAMVNPLFTQEPTSTALNTETKDSPTIELVAEEATARALDAEERVKMAAPIETHAAEPSTEAEVTLEKNIAAEHDSPAIELAAQEASALPMDPEELPKMTTPIEPSAVESFTAGNTDSVIEITAEQEVAILEAGNGDAECERETSVMLDNNKTKRVVDAEEESPIGQATSSVTDEISRQASSEDGDKLQNQKVTLGKRKNRNQNGTRNAARDNVTPADETFVEEDDDKEQPETDPMVKHRRTTGRNPPIGTTAETETAAAPAPAPAPKTRRGRITEPTAASSRRRRSASKALSSSVEPEPIPTRAPPRELIGVSEVRSSIEPEPLNIETGPVARDETASMTVETKIDEAHSMAPSIEGSPIVGESSTGRSLSPRKAPASRRSASIEPVSDEGKRRSGRTKKAAATAAPQVPLTPSRKRGASEIVQTPGKRSKATKAQLSAIKEEPTEDDVVKKPVKRGRKKV